MSRSRVQPRNTNYSKETVTATGFLIDRIIQAFQDLRYIGELRQRWFEIKKLLKGGLQDNVPAALRAA